MTSSQRREQLIEVARALFAAKGVDGTSVEEIAATAQVSKPVVYEHFGGKEGLYAVVVDRESRKFLEYVKRALDTPDAGSKELIERGTLGMLDYIDEWPDGFQIISRDQALGSSNESFASILSDITSWAEELLAEPFKRRGYDPTFAGLYAQALVGIVSMAGSWWMENRSISKEEVAANLLNLAWNGMGNLERHPQLMTRVIPPITDRRRRRTIREVDREFAKNPNVPRSDAKREAARTIIQAGPTSAESET